MDPFYESFLQDGAQQMTWSGPPMQGGSSTAAPPVKIGHFLVADTHGLHPVPDEELGQFSMGTDDTGTKKVTISKRKKKAEPKMDRAKWTDEEDEMLVSAWLNVSQDPVVGTDQTKDTYWDRIVKYFNTYRKPSMMPRSDKALINHMKLITDAVSKFAVHVRKVEQQQLNPSGTNERDKMARACTAYKGIEGKPFAYAHCWVMLAEHPKWHAHESAKARKMQEGAEAQSSPAACNEVPNDAASIASNEIPRPIGRQTAKAARARKSVSSTSLHTVSGGMYATRIAELTETKKVMVELKKEQISVMRLMASVRENDEDERIMNVDLDSVSGPLREYYMKRQEAIMARWNAAEHDP